jgi:hypothetical protein
VGASLLSWLVESRRYVLVPLLTLSLTLLPGASRLPARGFGEITRPFVTRVENAFDTLPTEQCAFRIARLAARSVFPLSLGTMHGSLNVAVTERAAVI